MVGFGRVAPVATGADAHLENVSKSNTVVRWNGHAVVKAGESKAGRACLVATSYVFGAGCLAAFIALLVIGSKTGNRSMMLGAIGPGLAMLGTAVFLRNYPITPAEKKEQEETLSSRRLS